MDVTIPPMARLDDVAGDGHWHQIQTRFSHLCECCGGLTYFPYVVRDAAGIDVLCSACWEA